MKYDNDWYNSLIKPKFQPPAWIFAPVWSVLYIFMFVALGLIIAAKFRWVHVFAYLFFVGQLVVNFLWSPAFFVEHNLRKAFLIAVLLSFSVFLTTIIFFNISIFAGLLFLIYFCWCCFACILSFEILELNEE